LQNTTSIAKLIYFTNKEWSVLTVMHWQGATLTPLQKKWRQKHNYILAQAKWFAIWGHKCTCLTNW